MAITRNSHTAVAEQRKRSAAVRMSGLLATVTPDHLARKKRGKRTNHSRSTMRQKQAPRSKKTNCPRDISGLRARLKSTVRKARPRSKCAGVQAGEHEVVHEEVARLRCDAVLGPSRRTR